MKHGNNKIFSCYMTFLRLEQHVVKTATIYIMNTDFFILWKFDYRTFPKQT